MKKYGKKILVDSRGDDGPWADIKRLINYAMTVDATYTQVAKGRDNDKFHFDAPVAKTNGNTGPIINKKSCRSEGRSSAFYEKSKQCKREAPSAKKHLQKGWSLFSMPQGRTLG